MKQPLCSRVAFHLLAPLIEAVGPSVHNCGVILNVHFGVQIEIE